MKSIKRALCSVLVCFGAFMFCTGTANAAEGTDVVIAESADNIFVDNNVTDNLATQEVTEVSDVTEVAEEKETIVDSEETKSKTKEKANKKKYNKADLRLLSAIISCEANNEPYAGKLAVGIVVMNRVKAKAFPNTVKGVIYQKFQFSPVRNGALKKALARYDAGKFKSKNEKQCIKAAKEALDGVKVVTYAGSKKSMKKYHYFSGSLRGAKYRISGHQFK